MLLTPNPVSFPQWLSQASFSGFPEAQEQKNSHWAASTAGRRDGPKGKALPTGLLFLPHTLSSTKDLQVPCFS